MNNPEQPKGFSRKSYEIPDCPVCLEELVTDLSCSPCGHVFHSMCILQSIESSAQCPCCRQRMTRASLTTLRFTLKYNNEAEEQIQAFYNSLANDEKQNVIEIMNKYETQTREFTTVKKHRDELVVTCRDQVDKIDRLEKADKEQTTLIKSLQLKTDQLSQKCHLQAMKIKDIEGLNQQDQIKIEEQKKVLSELRSIQILKEKMEQGRSHEDKYIEDIKRNKTYEEQAKRFFEMIQIKKGANDEIARENDSLRIQLQDQKQINDYGLKEIRMKENRIDELKRSNENQQQRLRQQKEKMEALTKIIEDNEKRSNQNKLLNLTNSEDGKIKADTQDLFEDENSNLSSKSIEFSEIESLQKPRKTQSSLTPSNLKVSVESVLSKPATQNIEGQNEQQQKLQDDKKRSFDSTVMQNLSQFKKSKYEKYQFGEAPGGLFSKNNSKPEAFSSVNSTQLTGGLGLFSLSTSKNSLLMRKQNQQEQLSANQPPLTEKKFSSINDFFKHTK